MRIIRRIHPDALYSNLHLGDPGNEYYFILQGFVAIKINNLVVKVRRSMTFLAPHMACSSTDQPILITTHPILCATRQILGERIGFGESAMECKVMMRRSATVGVGDASLP